MSEFDVQQAYANEDYEPYAIQRDKRISKLLNTNGIKFNVFKDQVIFAKKEIIKTDGTPYTIFTPYKNKWIKMFKTELLEKYNSERGTSFLKIRLAFPKLSELGFHRSNITVKNYDLGNFEDYEKMRNFPALDKTSHLSPHLRFGTISIRKIIQKTLQNESFLTELIWREFFIQILFHFPKIVGENFRKKYDNIQWRNDPMEFEKWKNGKTGYPLCRDARTKYCRFHA